VADGTVAEEAGGDRRVFAGSGGGARPTWSIVTRELSGNLFNVTTGYLSKDKATVEDSALGQLRRWVIEPRHNIQPHQLGFEDGGD
jgi:hypothetical protein